MDLQDRIAARRSERAEDERINAKNDVNLEANAKIGWISKSIVFAAIGYGLLMIIFGHLVGGCVLVFSGSIAYFVQTKRAKKKPLQLKE